MANPDYTAQDVPTWAANLDSMNSLKAVGEIGNHLLHLPLLNSLAFAKGVGSLTFARASIATYIDRYGVLQSAAIDEPRFDVDGLLMEGGSTNELDESDDFTGSPWILTGTMVRTGGQADPAGGTDAVLLDDTDVTSNLAYIQHLNVTILNDSLSHTVSIFLKPGSAAVSALSVFLTGGTGVSATMTVNWGALTVDVGTLKGPFSNGFYRLSLPVTNNTSGNTALSIRVHPAGDASAGAAIGTVTAFRAQHEKLPFATSPIATSGAPVTRSVDICYATIIGNIGLQADAGTILCDTDVLGLVEASALQTAISVSSETDRRIFAHGFGAVVNASWGSQAMTAAVMVPNVVERFGLRHEGGGAESLWRNGAEVDTDTGSDVADALGAEINIGGFSTAGSRPLFGHIRNIRIYDIALSDREMAVA